MDVALLNSKDAGGGAVQATLRLHWGLLETGIDSKLLVQYKSSSEQSIVGPRAWWRRLIGPYRPLLDSIPTRQYRRRQADSFSPSCLPDSVEKRIKQYDPDLVHLNWVTGGYLRIESIGAIDRPIVWTMHDMWPFTGGCHFSAGCTRYQERCGDCPILNSDDDGDLSRRVWNRKQSTFNDIDPVFVAPSRWLAKHAASSSLIGNCRIERIPYGLDLPKYRGVDGSVGREHFGLPSEAKVVLFGANAASNRKGYHHLKAALGALQGTLDELKLVVFGPFDGAHDAFGFPVHELGYLDQRTLRLAYAASDVLVIPSVQDNLPNVVLESMACGTPCVAFDIGGLSDMIDHGSTGYLADPFDREDLAAGIMEILLGDADRYERRSKAKVESEFDIVDVVEQYSTLYRELT